jgi:hypothetical protein
MASRITSFEIARLAQNAMRAQTNAVPRCSYRNNTRVRTSGPQNQDTNKRNLCVKIVLRYPVRPSLRSSLRMVFGRTTFARLIFGTVITGSVIEFDESCLPSTAVYASALHIAERIQHRPKWQRTFVASSSAKAIRNRVSASAFADRPAVLRQRICLARSYAELRRLATRVRFCCVREACSFDVNLVCPGDPCLWIAQAPAASAESAATTAPMTSMALQSSGAAAARAAAAAAVFGRTSRAAVRAELSHLPSDRCCVGQAVVGQFRSTSSLIAFAIAGSPSSSPPHSPTTVSYQVLYYHFVWQLKKLAVVFFCLADFFFALVSSLKPVLLLLRCRCRSNALVRLFAE